METFGENTRFLGHFDLFLLIDKVHERLTQNGSGFYTLNLLDKKSRFSSLKFLL